MEGTVSLAARQVRKNFLKTTIIVKHNTAHSLLQGRQGVGHVTILWHVSMTLLLNGRYADAIEAHCLTADGLVDDLDKWLLTLSELDPVLRSKNVKPVG